MEFWYARPDDGGEPPELSEAVPALFGHVGEPFYGLTIWTERPQSRPLIVTPHWSGYILDGYVYDAPGTL